MEKIGGVLLFGTPHRSSDAAPLGRMIAKTAQAIQFGDSNLVSDIKADSMETHDLLMGFTKIMNQKDLFKTDAVVSFFENQSTDLGRRLGWGLHWNHLVECFGCGQY
jgi:hypothetical protein